MMRFAIAQVLANRLRLGMTVLAIVLGVAFVTGSMVLSATAQRLFDEQFTTANAGVDLTVRQATEFDSGMGVEVERDPLPATTLDRVRSVEGVESATPVARGAARLQHQGTDLAAVQLSTYVESPLGSYPLRAGEGPTLDDEVAIDAAAAERLGLQIGDSIVLDAETSVSAEIVGLVGYGASAGPPAGVAVLAPLGTAQQALALDAAISEVLVTTDVPTAEMQERLAQTLGSDVQVASVQDLAAAGAEAAAANLQLLQLVLVAMSVAALLVGSFLIANTFAIVISGRLRQLAVLRAVGATGRQLLVSVLIEAAVVGAAASAVGVAAGIAGALALRGVARGFGVSIPDGPLAVEPLAVALGFGIGLMVTVVAAAGPARRASRVSPMLALRSAAAEARSISRRRTIAGLALIVGGLPLGALPSIGAPMPLLAVALAAVVVGVVVAGPSLVRLMLRVARLATARLGITGELATETAHRSPRRTSTTVMALALCLTMMSFITVVVASVKEGTAAQYREIITADVVIESAAQEMLGGVHPEVFDEVAAATGVDVVSRLRYGHWRDGETISALGAVDPETLEEVAAIRMIDGSLDWLRGGGIVITDRVAEERALAVGDQLPMTFAREGELALDVVGIMAGASAQALQTDYFISLDRYSQLFTEDMDASIFVTAVDGMSPAALRDSLEAALADHPAVEVRDQAAVIEGRTKTVDQLFGLVSVLLAFAAVIAVLGIANTLALSISERTRELGLLRAIGMSRRGLAATVLAEAAITAGMAAIIGLLVGIVAARLTVGALGVIAPLSMLVPVAELGVIAALIAVAGVVAGIAPARRAARLPVLEAIAHA
jgi:putative ABC transport system permease protein